MASFYGTLGIAVFIGFLAGVGLVELVGMIRKSRDLRDYLEAESVRINVWKREHNGNKNGKSGTVGKSRVERHGRG